MKKIILLTAIYAVPGIAFAGLQVSATPSDLGKFCYSESTGAESSHLYACDRNGAGLDMDWQDLECPPTYADSGKYGYGAFNECYIGSNNGIDYFCGGLVVLGEACDFCQFSDSATQWTDIGNNRVSRIYKSVPKPHQGQGPYAWKCVAESTESTQYGCAAGYYADVSTGTATMTCMPCPDGGTNANGTVLKTSCYLPAGTFSDETGSGTISGTCYWKN